MTTKARFYKSEILPNKMSIKSTLGTILIGSMLVFSPLKSGAQELETWIEKTERTVINNIILPDRYISYYRFKEEGKTITYEEVLSSIGNPLEGSIIVRFDNGDYAAYHDVNYDLIVDLCVMGNQSNLDYYFGSNSAHKLIMEKAQENFQMYLQKIQEAMLKQAGVK